MANEFDIRNCYQVRVILENGRDGKITPEEAIEKALDILSVYKHGNET
jgi:hypothetical protein